MTEQAAPGASDSVAHGHLTDDDAFTGEPLCDEARAIAAAPGGDTVESLEDRVALLRRALASGEPSAPALLAHAHLARGERPVRGVEHLVA